MPNPEQNPKKGVPSDSAHRLAEAIKRRHEAQSELSIAQVALQKARDQRQELGVQRDALTGGVRGEAEAFDDGTSDFIDGETMVATAPKSLAKSLAESLIAGSDGRDAFERHATEQKRIAELESQIATWTQTITELEATIKSKQRALEFARERVKDAAAAVILDGGRLEAAVDAMKVAEAGFARRLAVVRFLHSLTAIGDERRHAFRSAAEREVFYHIQRDDSLIGPLEIWLKALQVDPTARLDG